MLALSAYRFGSSPFVIHRPVLVCRVNRVTEYQVWVDLKEIVRGPSHGGDQHFQSASDFRDGRCWRAWLTTLMLSYSSAVKRTMTVRVEVAGERLYP